MKVCKFRVNVPVDDAAMQVAVQEFLRETLEHLGTMHLAGPTNGSGEAGDLAGPKPGARMHWSAVEVLQGEERPMVPARKASSISRKSA
jgi:hypothetical protein